MPGRSSTVTHVLRTPTHLRIQRKLGSGVPVIPGPAAHRAPDPAGSIALRVKAEPFAVAATGTSVMYQPLGEDRPVVLSEGYKGDAIELTLILKREPPREGCFTAL